MQLGSQTYTGAQIVHEGLKMNGKRSEKKDMKRNLSAFLLFCLLSIAGQELRSIATFEATSYQNFSPY